MTPSRPPRVYADFNNADPKGRVRLNCAGTKEDLARQMVTLRQGMLLSLYSDDADDTGRQDELEVPGTVQYSDEEQDWVAVVDWQAVRHVGASGDSAAGRKAV